jgi:hypothetical protein
MGGALKDSANDFFKSSYADLESVINAFRGHATANEISFTQGGGLTVDGLVVVTTLLIHSSGEWILTETGSKPKDHSPQAVGSAVTYNRRYGIAAAFGVYQTDDDGEAAQGRTHAPPFLPADVEQTLKDAAADGLDALKLAWKKLDADKREIVTKHHNKWWADLKASCNA